MVVVNRPPGSATSLRVRPGASDRCLLKRTTARKFYMLLPKVKDEDRYAFGNLIFFDNLKHVGIIDTPSTFYHAQLSRGTNLSPLNSFWRKKVYGFRALPLPAEQ